MSIQPISESVSHLDGILKEVESAYKLLHETVTEVGIYICLSLYLILLIAGEADGQGGGYYEEQGQDRGGGEGSKG